MLSKFTVDRFASMGVMAGSLMIWHTLALGGELSASLSHPPNQQDSRVVIRTLSDGAGGFLRLHVTAPEGQRVDARFFDALEIHRQSDANRVSEGGDSSTHQKPQLNHSEPVDVSGYSMEVSSLAGTSVSCQAAYAIRWSSGVTLAPNAAMNVTFSNTPEEVISTVYPQGGDVNVFIYEGNTLLGASTNGPTLLDTVGVYNSACENATGQFKVVISNPSTTSGARFVGSISYMVVTAL